MYSMFHRHTALFILSLQILMNCIVLPFHRHEMMPNAGPWAITAAAEEGTDGAHEAEADTTTTGAPAQRLEPVLRRVRDHHPEALLTPRRPDGEWH